MQTVEYTKGNVDRCQCGKCPVYKSSQCAEEKNAKLEQVAARRPLEGMYCAPAVGKSACDDLDSVLACQCFSCLVFEECGLSDGYFCIRGAAG